VRKPTLKQKKFIKKYLETGNQTEAVVSAYDVKSRTNAGAMGSQIMSRPHIQRYLNDLLDEQGLSDDRIAHKLRKIVDAGTRRTALKDTTPQTALEAIKFTAKLKDLMPSKKIEQQTAVLNLNLTNKTTEELQTSLDTLAKEINSFQKKFKTK